MNDWQSEARRLVQQRLAAEPGRVAALWAEVEAEAWHEVRAVLKAEMVTALLEALGQRTATDKPAANTPPEKDENDGAPAAEPPVLLDAQTGQSDDPTASLIERPAPTSDAPAPAPLGQYVYGVVDRTDLTGLPSEGTGAAHPVTLLAYGELAAVVSAAPLDEWGEEPLKANLGDIVWLEARVRGHQAVLDAMLPLATLIPMKFATIYLDLSGVERFLADHYDAFIALLGQLRGRQEWGLKLYCDAATLAAHIAEISPEVAQLRAEMAGKPRGAAYLLARKLQEISDSAGERVEAAVAEQTHTALADRSVAAILNPLQGSEITGRCERMLLNAAYLVDAAALGDFEAALVEIAAEYRNRGFQFELSGPWPAYNFATLPAGEATSDPHTAQTSGL